ncbi:hypothetical protein LVD15_17000 [Fulvivirga maritima]|uniref:hypothetical protein n=1 Tax=Fulvivirga maritima TaxID=2904247 RepID=UPI001F2D5A54|nr:hypothetical protein [Fulvivirga maritima]UII24998.1 hypothetical protein LVD15_17000 [Fulvivirga maritima]
MSTKFTLKQILKYLTSLDTVLKLLLIVCILITVFSLFNSSAYITTNNERMGKSARLRVNLDSVSTIIYPEILFTSLPYHTGEQMSLDSVLRANL